MRIAIVLLLIGMTLGAGGLRRSGGVRHVFDVGMTVDALEHLAVDRSAELGLIHREANLLTILVLRHRRIVMAGQAVGVRELRRRSFLLRESGGS